MKHGLRLLSGLNNQHTQPSEMHAASACWLQMLKQEPSSHQTLHDLALREGIVEALRLEHHVYTKSSRGMCASSVMHRSPLGTMNQ